MCSRKNHRQLSKKAHSARTNGEDLKRAVTWIVKDTIFANVALHGNVKWTATALVRLTVFWMWNPALGLVDAAQEAMSCVDRIFGDRTLKSYQAIMNALKRYSNQLLPLLWHRLQDLMQECDAINFRVGLWLVLAMDGSRVDVPRTLKNERAFCKPPRHGKQRKKKAKKRGRHAKRPTPPTHTKKHYDPQAVGPQVWLTLIWHIGQRLPWCWETGPSYSSERHHVLKLLHEQTFPENTLFCGDAGFVGYDFWETIADQGHHFLARVGGNVRLLKNLGYVRERRGIVYCWPEAAMKKKQPPLVLRLLHFQGARNDDIYLVTNVLDEKLLSDRQAGEVFRRRWGIEIQFRSFKQTFGRTKLRGRTPECAMVELQWSLVALWMVQLLARKEQTKAGEPEVTTSVAAVLRIVREMMLRDRDVPSSQASLPRQLAEAVGDNYQRKTKKKSRNYPRRKEEPATGKPTMMIATANHKLRLKQILTLDLANAA